MKDKKNARNTNTKNTTFHEKFSINSDVSTNVLEKLLGTISIGSKDLWQQYHQMLSKNFYKLMVRKALTFYSLSQIKNIYLKRKKEKKRKERQMHNILFDFHRIYGTIHLVNI